jgi:hypothetical protein
MEILLCDIARVAAAQSFQEHVMDIVYSAKTRSNCAVCRPESLLVLDLPPQSASFFRTRDQFLPNNRLAVHVGNSAVSETRCGSETPEIKQALESFSNGSNSITL